MYPHPHVVKKIKFFDENELVALHQRLLQVKALADPSSNCLTPIDSIQRVGHAGSGTLHLEFPSFSVVSLDSIGSDCLFLVRDLCIASQTLLAVSLLHNDIDDRNILFDPVSFHFVLNDYDEISGSPCPGLKHLSQSNHCSQTFCQHEAEVDLFGIRSVICKLIRRSSSSVLSSLLTRFPSDLGQRRLSCHHAVGILDHIINSIREKLTISSAAADVLRALDPRPEFDEALQKADFLHY